MNSLETKSTGHPRYRCAKTRTRENTFYYASTPDANDISNYTNSIIYWYHANSGGANVEPLSYSTQKVSPQTNELNQSEFNKQYACPSIYSSSLNRDAGLIQEQLAAYTVAVDSITVELNLLIDGGDTEILNDNVLTSWPEETMEIRNSLLTASPYLSDTVMISATNKEDVLPGAILTEVLVANPQSAKSDKVLSAVDNRVNPLTQNQYDQLMSGRLISGAKEKLEARLSSVKSKRELAFKSQLMVWKEDSIGNNTDSVINFLENENERIAKYALTDEYMNKQDSLSAIATYQAIGDQFEMSSKEYNEWQYYNDWLLYRIEQLAANKPIDEPDSLQRIALYQIYNNVEDGLKTTVRNLLKYSDTLTYHEPYLTADTTLKNSNVIWRPIEEEGKSNQLLVYPNPATNYFIVDFSGISSTESILYIEIYNAEGKLIKRYEARRQNGFIVIDTQLLRTGVYLVNIANLTQSTYKSKVLVSH